MKTTTSKFSVQREEVMYSVALKFFVDKVFHLSFKNYLQES